MRILVFGAALVAASLLAPVANVPVQPAFAQAPAGQGTAGQGTAGQGTAGQGTAGQTAREEETFSQNEIVDIASDFFGLTSSAVGGAVERVFSELGRPVGYVRGGEVSGAVGVGLRYGEGELVLKNGSSRKVYWQGPSIGFDVGGNASKTFTLVYGMTNPESIYKRYPGVDGSFYFVAGISVNYQRLGSVTLVPMRTGVGLRAGANAGYLKYSRKKRILPL